MNIKFVSYTGKYPNLCIGILTLLVDDKEYKFHYTGCEKENDYYEDFWLSEGSVNYETDEINKGNWIINKDELPEELQPYYKEIEKIFNENVPKGCCGGCI